MTRSPRNMLLAAVGCAVAFVLLLTVAYTFGPARWADAAALDSFSQLRDPTLGWYADPIARSVDPFAFAALVTVLLLAAFAIRGLRHTIAVGFLLVAANVSSQVLKPALAHERASAEWSWTYEVAAAAFPSGHATAAMSLALGAVIVAPRAFRAIVAAIGGVFAILVAMSLLILSWHYPSDIVGGYLLATGWCLVVLAALRAAAARWPDKGQLRRATLDALPAPPPRVLVTAAVVVAIGMLAALAGRAGELARYAERHTWAAVVAVGITVSATLLVAAVAALDGQRRR